MAAAGGKRFRPLLTILASELGSGVNDQVVAAATGVELTHLASLYHDDVMDDARLRRGVPAAQTVWSNSVAILAGDLQIATTTPVKDRFSYQRSYPQGALYASVTGWYAYDFGRSALESSYSAELAGTASSHSTRARTQASGEMICAQHMSMKTLG